MRVFDDICRPWLALRVLRRHVVEPFEGFLGYFYGNRSGEVGHMSWRLDAN
jgi:hypothetical protein